MARGLRALVAIVAVIAVAVHGPVVEASMGGLSGLAVPRAMPMVDAKAVSPVFLETGQIGMCVEDTPNIKGLLPQTCCNNMKCPYAKGVCCSGDSHCCPQGTVCVQGDPGTPPGCLHILDHPKVREIAGLPPLPPKPKPAAPPCDPKKDPCCKVCVEPTQPCYCGNNQPVPPPPPPPPPSPPRRKIARRVRKPKKPKYPMNGTLTYEDVHAPNPKNDFFLVKSRKTKRHHAKRVVKHLTKLEAARGSFDISQPPHPPALYDINRLRRLREHDNRKVYRKPKRVNGKKIEAVKPVLKPEEQVQSTQPQPIALGLEKKQKRSRNVDVPETPKIKEIMLNLPPPAKGAPPVASKSFKVELSEAPRFREVLSSTSASSPSEPIDSADSTQESDAKNFPDMSDTQTETEQQQAPLPHAASRSAAKKEVSLDKEIISLFASSDPGIPIPI